MLSVAKRARASNETLYRWYGDKPRLYRALVARNAEAVRAQLTADLAAGGSPRAALERFGPALLGLLVSERAIALNRAAAADPSGALGTALAEAGRGTVAPLIGAVLERARAAGLLDFNDTQAVVARYLDLLVGDLQIRRAIGALSEPAPPEIADRAARALADLLRLHPPREGA